MPDSGGYHKNNYWLYFKASWEGALRGGALLIIEHPLESIKTQWQDKIQFKSKKEIVHNIYKEKGLVGFYRGFVPNLIRVMSKQFYRWPMMLFFPRLYSKYLPNRIKKKFPTINKILSGFTIANIEIFLICPLDRMKIYFMTMTGTSALATSHLISNFFIINKNKLIPELFRGLESSFWRSNISWISFLYLDEKFKQIWKKSKLRSGKSQELTYFDLLVISILVGTGNLIAIMPFDFVKTQAQKENCVAKESTLKIMSKYYHKFGIRVLYTGWQFRSCQYLFQSMVTVASLERLENKLKRGD